ncbi:MAG: peptidylprolyl isomerase [Planctomycetales bacterium]|nr:peptidylprolyl isomerase [Planctomycetales bacterium]
MSGKEAQPNRHWKKRISMLLIGAFMAVGVLAIRGLLGPAPSNAQAPVRRPQSPTVRQSQPLTTQRGQVAQTAGTPAAGSRVVQTAATASTADGMPSLQTIQTMALVNGQPITRSELSRACLVRFGETVLESLVNKHLIWQECQKRGVVITEQDVTDEINEVASRFGLSVDRWLELLRDERDITPLKYKREIIWPQLALRRLAASDIEVTEAELKQAMESEYGPKVSCRMISVKDRAKAEQVLARVKAKPESFGDVAKDESEDTNSASARGLIQPIRKHVGSKEIEDVAFKLSPGEISPIISVAEQHIILKCEKILNASFVPAQNMEAVRKRLSDSIRDQKMRDSAQGLFQRLQKDARVVNVYNSPELRGKHPNVAALINDRPITIEQLSLECLERHGLEVLKGEITRSMLTQELTRRKIQVSQAAIDAEVARAADSFGFLKDGAPDVEGWLNEVTQAEGVTREVYVTDAVWPSVALKQLVQQRVQVTQEDLQKGFESNYGPRVEVQAIVFSNGRQAQQVWARAKADNSEKSFGELAYQYSIEPVSRANYGRVPPIRRHGGHQKLEEEAFRLQPGELSSVVASGDKYIILRCIGRTKPVEVTMNDVQKELVRDIHESKIRVEMAKEFDRLNDASKVTNYLAQLVKPGKPEGVTPVQPVQPATAAAAGAGQGVRQTSGTR